MEGDDKTITLLISNTYTSTRLVISKWKDDKAIIVLISNTYTSTLLVSNNGNVMIKQSWYSFLIHILVLD